MRRMLMVILLVILGLAEVRAQVVVIGHKAVPIDTLTRAQLLDLYTGDVKSWSNKTPVVVLDLAAQSETKNGFYMLLGLTSSRIKSIRLKKLLLGEGDPPELLKSEDEVVKKVTSTPGAIGYVSQSKAGSEVKIIRIVGKEKNPSR